MLLSAGDRVDRYQVVQFLGSGGMGEVYRAHDPKLRRPIALKILRADLSMATVGRQSLLREARAVATVSRPNVLSVFDVGELTEPEHLRGVAYIAMELVVGSALRAHVGDPSVPIEKRVGWLRDIANALAAAHEAGVVHRDVKPENVMIRFDGVLKVLDFGVARTLRPTEAISSTEAHSLPTLGTSRSIVAGAETGETGAPGRVTGTLYYMAPEQLRGEAVDGRGDQFAWGVVAHELLVGKPPWTSEDAIAIVSQILSQSPVPPGDIDPRIPREVSDAIMRALSKDPAARFSTMRELLSSLDRGARTTATRSEPALIVRPSRRAWPVFAAALVAIGGTALAVSRSRPSSPLRQLAVPAAIPTDGCTSSAACSRAHGGGAWRCQSIRHECVELASLDCRVLAQPSDLANDETVWIGALYPTTGPTAVHPDSEPRALDLAREDFAGVLGVGQGATNVTRARPIGLVLCDEGADPVRAAKHLAMDVQVPAIVGFRSLRAARSVIPEVFLPEHIASFITISSSPELTHIPQRHGEPRLVWRTTLDGNDLAAPLAALVSDVLAPLAHAAGNHDTIRVALTREGRDHTDITDEIFRALRFNGKSALENGNDFRQYIIDDTMDAGADQVVEALLAFRPPIIFVSGPTFVSKVLLPLEKRWARGPRPFYLITAGDFGAEIAAFAGKDADRRHRFFGITNRSTLMTNAQLVLRYNRAFPNEPVNRTIAPQPSYDAFYLLAYAILALGDEPITGPSISRAMSRLLPPGRPIDVGPQGIFDAFTTLRAGENVDLNGALGSLDFDPATGEAPIDYAIVRLGVDDHGAASGSVESGLTYDATAKKLTGTLRCP